ncbi:hypothetical protein BC835DRAFT_1417617 [Cytidiella melzeri]|nr:hypothetical protein BC835DRAFT_1417617 [Cytidiella melzeri]
MLSIVVATGLVAIVNATRPLLFAPHELCHLPRVPTLHLLWSYLSGESEDARIRRLILPFASEKNEELVLVWALGRWMVGIEVFADIDRFRKEDPPDDLLLWRLIGRNHILLSNGEQWRRHSKDIRSAINQAIPIAKFASLSYRLFSVVTGDGQSVQRFDDFLQWFALDAST